MPRSNKKEIEVTPAAPDVFDEAIAARQAARQTTDPNAERGIDEAKAKLGAEVVEQNRPGHADASQKRKFERVRSWHTERRGTLDFRKMTDADRRIIFFKFTHKPDDETLAILKSDEMKQAGVRFEDSRVHGKIWTIPNDEEGRITADRLGYKLAQLAEKRAEASKAAGQNPGVSA